MHQVLVALPILVGESALACLVFLWAARGMKKEESKCSESSKP